MNHLKRILCLLLAVCMAASLGAVHAGASSAAEMTEAAQAEKKESWQEIPLYFQTDYPETRFANGSVAADGSCITALAMVATYLTEHEYLPDELARYFGDVAKDNIARLEKGSKTMWLPFRKAEDVQDTLQALRDGKVAIALMDSTSLFTDDQHFIVLTGLNKDGKIMVNDPYAPHYDDSKLAQSFQEGFAEKDIMQGCSDAWIYDKSAMSENPYLYSKAEPVRGETRYPEITLTLKEKHLLAKVLWVEARGEVLSGQQAVAEIVLNRMVSEDFPDTLDDVIYEEGAFRSVPLLEEAAPNGKQYEAIENAIYGPNILPKDVFYFAPEPVNKNVWGTIGGHTFCYSED